MNANKYHQMLGHANKKYADYTTEHMQVNLVGKKDYQCDNCATEKI